MMTVPLIVDVFFVVNDKDGCDEERNEGSVMRGVHYESGSRTCRPPPSRPVVVTEGISVIVVSSKVSEILILPVCPSLK